MLGFVSDVYHAFVLPDPGADPKLRPTLAFYNLRHRSIGAQKWGIYFLDPPGGRGLDHLGQGCTQTRTTSPEWSPARNRGQTAGARTWRSSASKCHWTDLTSRSPQIVCVVFQAFSSTNSVEGEVASGMGPTFWMFPELPVWVIMACAGHSNSHRGLFQKVSTHEEK